MLYSNAMRIFVASLWGYRFAARSDNAAHLYATCSAAPHGKDGAFYKHTGNARHPKRDERGAMMQRKRLWSGMSAATSMLLAMCSEAPVGFSCAAAMSIRDKILPKGPTRRTQFDVGLLHLAWRLMNGAVGLENVNANAVKDIARSSFLALRLI